MCTQMRTVMASMWVAACLLAPPAVAGADPLTLLHADGIDASLLGRLWAPLEALRGAVRVSVVASGGVGFAVEGRALRWGKWPIGDVRAVYSAPIGEPWRILEVTVTGPLAERIDLRARWSTRANGIAPRRVRIDARGLDLGHLTTRWPRLALGGRIEMHAEVVADDLEAPSVSAWFDAADLWWRADRVGHARGDWRHRDARSVAHLRVGETDAPWLTIAADVPLVFDREAFNREAFDIVWLDTLPVRIALDATGITRERLRPIWRVHPAADFEFDAGLSATGPLSTLAVVGRIEGTVRDRARAPLALRGALTASPTAQSASLTVGDGVFSLEVETDAPLVALRRGHRTGASVPVRGAARLDVPLPMAAPYLPSAIFDPIGQLRGEIAATGTLGAPAFAGRVESSDASFTATDLRQRLEHAQLAIVADGDRFVLETLEAHSGDGHATASGEVRLAVTPSDAASDAALWHAWSIEGAWTLVARRLPFLHDTLPNGRIDGQVEGLVRAGPGVAHHEAVITGARVELSEARVPSFRGVPRNPRVHSIDADDDTGEVFDLRDDGHSRVRLRFGEPVPVDGAGVSMVLTGDLLVERDGTLIRVEGGIDVQPGGQFALFENRFEIVGGRFTLAEGDLAAWASVGVDQAEAGHASLGDDEAAIAALPTEAVVDLEARGRAEETDVTVAVRGPARWPALVLSADPALPPYQILTLLITGRVDTVDDRDGDVRRQVARIVERFHNPSLSRQLYDRLGVDKLGLGFGKSVSQPIVTVGKQIDRRLYVETVYRHDAPPDANEKEGHVEYLLPSYGLAEATVFATAIDDDRRPRMLTLDGGAFVGCGRSRGDGEVCIVEPDSRRPVADGEVGEIWLRGPHVAAGYWGDAKATAESFNQSLADDSDETQPRTGWLRTGDLGFQLEGDLCVTGRIKDLIIVAGRNVYPQDIEALAEQAHAAIRPGCVAAFSYLAEGEEKVVIFAELRDTSPPATEVREALAQSIGRDFGIRLHALGVLPKGRIPKTTSGKLQRNRCRKILLDEAIHARVGLALLF